MAGLLERDGDVLEALPSGSPPRALPTREDLEEELARFHLRHSSLDLAVVLRRFKHREVARLALSDFLHLADLAAITRALSLLADVILDRAVRAARGALEARHGRPTARDDRGRVEDAGFVVLGLGKLGGEELNYSSDIDIVYLYGRDGETTGAAAGGMPNRLFFARLAAEVTRLIGGSGPGGEVFRVDLNLRPGGRDGDLAMPLGAAVAYYRSWAESWERQALIKARPVAGDLDLGRRFVDAVTPLVFPERPDPSLAVDIGAMKDRIDDALRLEGHGERDVKLGRGGIRELEFAVQALQLQRAGADPWLRQGNTLLALHRLSTRGLVGLAEYAALQDAYTFLRHVEHRLQLVGNRQTALLPAAPEAWRPLARLLFLPSPVREDETDLFASALERHRIVVRAFYDSVIGAAAQRALQGEAPDLLLDRLDDEAIRARLEAAGFSDAGSLLRPVHALRRVLEPARLPADVLQGLRRAGPALLRAAHEGPSPRRALQHLEALFAQLAGDPEALRRFLLHRERPAATVRLMSRSDLLAGLLLRQPDMLGILEDRAHLVRAMAPGDLRHDLLHAARSDEDGAAALRRRQQAFLTIIVLRDLNRQAGLRETLLALSDLADAAVAACLDLACLTVDREAAEAARGLSVLGLGRLGYRELDYGSDLDLLFVHAASGTDPARERAAASRACESVVRFLSTLSRDGQMYRVDLRLRPSGSKGEMVHSPEGLLAYFRESADVWEMQSFLKARAVAGRLDLGDAARTAAERAILDRSGALSPGDLAFAVRDMRRRLAEAWKGPPESRRPKHGPGGLSDVDFAIEFLQLRHGVVSPDEKDTPRLLGTLRDRGHLDPAAYAALYEGERFLRRLDHEVRLLHGRALEALPADPRHLEEIAAGLDRMDEPPTAETLLPLYDRRTASVRRAFEAVLSS
jgi:glutamate-ammonia-ligase adenylyltransferase